MFGKTKKSTEPDYTNVVDKLMSELDEYGPDTEEFKAAMGYLDKIHKFRSINRRGVDGNTIAIVAGNIACVLIVVSYERMHVVTTKALGYVMKSQP